MLLRVSSSLSNQPPVVDAGSSMSISGLMAQLTGSATDDEGPPAVQWSMVSGPGSASFVPVNATTTTVTVTVAGTYVFQLAATDSATTVTDTVSVTFTTVSSACAGINDCDAIVGFDPQVNLPTQLMRDIHTDFWAAYDTPRVKNGITWTRGGDQFQDPMGLMIDFPLDYTDSRGSYSIARPFGIAATAIVDFLRTTGDPRCLDELLYWLTEIRTNGLLADHDGRGYDYIVYGQPANADNVDNDTNFLDEQMMAAVLAIMAYPLHKNRTLNPLYAAEADFWLRDYLDANWVPKWLYRCFHSGITTGPDYTPPTSLGLQNALGWSSPTQNAGLDSRPAFNPYFPKFDNTMGMMFPVRQYAHPFIMSIGLYHVLGNYFVDTGQTPVGNWNGTAQQYLDEVVARETWWLRQCSPSTAPTGTGSPQETDGSRTWWIDMFGGTGNYTAANQAPGENGLQTATYSQYCNYMCNFLHWEQVGHWADPAEMVKYRKQWWHYTGTPGNWTLDGDNSALDPNDQAFMAEYTSVTNNDTVAYTIRTTGYFAAFDDTGFLRDELDRVTAGGTGSHLIGNGTASNMTTGRNDITHYAAMMSYERLQAEQQSLC